MVLFISGVEIAFVLFIVVLLFGADKIPDIARNLSKGMNYLKDATNSIKYEITQNIEKKELNLDATSDIKDAVEDVKETLDDLTNSIKRKSL